MLNWQAAQIATTIAVTEKEIVDRERARELLADYSFEQERDTYVMPTSYRRGTTQTAAPLFRFGR